MMQGFRKAGQTWLGRVVVGVLFGMLILSFAIWGIGDMLRGGAPKDVAIVGSTEISTQAFRDAYQTEVQNLSRRIRRNLTPTEARSLGLEQRVLERLIADAAMDERVKRFGLAISDDTIAKAILVDKNFQGSDGRFNRGVFDEVLRTNGFNEKGFVATQRNVYLRGQIGEAIGGGVSVPQMMVEVLHRYRAEKRDILHFTVGPDAVGEVPAATEAQLKTFFEEHKAEFRAPEYRVVSLLSISPTTTADPASVSDADAKAAYERLKATRFTSPEKRTVRQMVFPDKAAAEAAAAKIRGGASFDVVATERGLKDSDTDLGTVLRSGIADPAVAQAAFSAEANALVGPVDGRFGTVLVLVTAIQPEVVVSFEQAAPTIKAELARAAAVEKVRTLHDTIEDQRASAKPIADVAKDVGLQLVTINGVDRSGLGRDGQPVAIPEPQTVLNAIFASDIGVDNEAVATREGGWVWYAVEKIDPARDRTLAEVQPSVEAAWKADETIKRVAAMAADAVKKINGGTKLEDVAAELKLEAMNSPDVTRAQQQQQQPGTLPATAISQAFLTRVGQAASALGATPSQRVVMSVTRAEVPAMDPATVPGLASELEYALADDMLNVFVTETKREVGVTINDAAIRLALGNSGN